MILLFLLIVFNIFIEEIYEISSKMVGDNILFSVVRDLMSLKLGELIIYLDEFLLKIIFGVFS